jgi:tRNA (guanine26-N2/guanine27-N2)-dimethyltransferase
MEMNRDISILICQYLVNNSKGCLKLIDGLAASGIRGLRISKEVEGDFQVIINDWNKDAFELIKKNADNKKIRIENRNLNGLLSEEKFDYIDIDPFGSPVSFIDSTVRSIKNEGLIAVTATDTATLCGVYPKVCFRRYTSIPFHSNCMKEIGLRILIGFVCREAAKYDKGIEPILSYTTDHYFRTYVRVRKGVNRANDSMKKYKKIITNEPISHNKQIEIGPLWMGNIHSKRAIKEFRTILNEKTLGTKNQLWQLFITDT